MLCSSPRVNEAAGPAAPNLLVKTPTIRLFSTEMWNSPVIRCKVPPVKSVAFPLFLVLFCISTGAQGPQMPHTKRTGWVLRFDGIGPVRVGMTVNQLNAVLDENFSTPTDKDEQTCFYVQPRQHRDTGIMILYRRVARVDVFAPKGTSPSTATADGVRIGDSEARVLKLYGQKVAVSPHAYTDGGHYLTIRSSKYGLRFETDGIKVTGFYAGTTAAIAFIEGCS